MAVDNIAGLEAAALAEVEAAVAGHRSLEEVARAALARGSAIAEIVVQDEFTHDVIVPLRGELHLVYDTT